MQTLPEWLKWVVGGGAGAITWALVALLRKWPAFVKAWDSVPSEIGRYAVFLVASLIGAGGFWVQVQLGYAPAPGDVTAWLEMLFSIVVSQVVYTGVKLLRR